MTLELCRKSDVFKLFPILFLIIFFGGCAVLGGSTESHKHLPSTEQEEVEEKVSSKDNPLKPYEKIIPESAETKEGLFIIHEVDDKIFFEIPDSLLGRDLLVVNRLSKGPVDNQPDDRGAGSSMLGYAGDRINKKLIRLEKGPDNKLFIRAISYSVIPDSTNSMYQAVLNSNTQPIINALDIKAVGKDSASVVVDMTDQLIENERLFAFGKEAKKAMELSKLSSDRSYVKEINSFPENTEIKTVRTYSRLSGSGSVGVPQLEPSQGIPASAEVSTLEINSSILLLPKEPMEPRYYDERVGYFATGHTDYDSSEGVENTYMVTRWDLEPREEDIEKYKRGELVEPKEPIIYYIDPATPDKWVPYLKQGVNAWQKAFEKAGFKNAIKAKEAPTPEEDSTWSLMDSRYSAIVYKASSISNASGPHINDPRSGEILESHINWYHNVMKLARNWYIVQASPSDTAARDGELSDELMGQLIKYVATHEVGHALGLRHNMGASFATPVEKLRDREWLKKHGHTSSIMDYARFNYVAQPEDSVGRAGLFPRINDYDFWAIQWGYKRFPGKTKDEKKILAEWTTEKTENPRLRFISGEEGRPDPRAQTEDLGNNAMKASAYGIENLQFIVPRLTEWTVTKGEDYSTLSEIYHEVINQYFTYISHVIENIGGIYHTPKVAGQQGKVYKITPEERQKQAVSFIGEYALHKPEWLFEGAILDKIWSPGNELTTKIAKLIINKLYNNSRLLRLDNFASRDSADSVYTVSEYMKDVHQSLWSELSKGGAVSNYRRTLQNVYIAKMEKLIMPYQSAADDLLKQIAPASADVSKTDIPSIARYLLRSLQKDIAAALPKIEDEMTKIHLDNIQSRINSVLKKEL